MTKTVTEIEKLYRDAQAAAIAAKNVAEVERSRARIAAAEATEYERTHGRPPETFVSDVSPGTRADLPIRRPLPAEQIEELEARAAELQAEAAKAKEAFLSVRSRPRTSTESDTGFKAGRSMKLNGTYFDPGDPVDVDSLPKDKLSRLVGAGFVVPSGRR